MAFHNIQKRQGNCMLVYIVHFSLCFQKWLLILSATVFQSVPLVISSAFTIFSWCYGSLKIRLLVFKLFPTKQKHPDQQKFLKMQAFICLFLIELAKFRLQCGDFCSIHIHSSHSNGCTDHKLTGGVFMDFVE